jgi:hypothetical protein
MAQVKPLPMVAALLCALGAQCAFAQDPSKADQAHLLMGQGNAQAAMMMMREHVAEHPGDGAARMDLARYLAWNGDYAQALKVLLADPAAADSPEGRALHAYILAGAGRMRGARELDAPLLAAGPQSFQANYNEAIALSLGTRPALAQANVDAARALQPGKDVDDLGKRVWVRRASFLRFGIPWYWSSDKLSSLQPTLSGEYAVNEALRLTGELGHWSHDAQGDSNPYQSIDGGGVDEDRLLLGLRYAPGDYTELSFAVGHSSIPGDGTTLWRVRGDASFSDSFSGSLAFEHDRQAASPRALSLGITRNSGELHLHFTPDFNWTGDAWLHRDDFSDGNSRGDVILALRRAAVRKPKLLLDLGGIVEHMHYDSYTTNGYYAPDNYRHYGLTAHAYVGLGPETGLSLHAVLGRQRDETFDSWTSANDFDATLLLGALSKWEWRLTAAYSQRALNTGAYEGYSLQALVTRRF